MAGGNVPSVSLLPGRFFHSCNFGSASQITAQINVLNSDYASCGFSFTLAGTTRTVNADWFNNAAPDTSQEIAMKSSLRQGGAAALNVYTVGFAIHIFDISMKGL